MNKLSETTRLTVGIDHAGERLDIFLAHAIDHVSRSKIQDLVEKGRVSLNGRVAIKKTVLREGDEIDVSGGGASPSSDAGPQAQNIPLEILYEDESLLAINKPAGMVVHPGNGVPDGTLVNALLHHVKHLSAGWEASRPGIVHRLDKDTSGIVLVAKNDVAHTELGRMFAEREVHKQYVGICIGRRPGESGTISEALGRSKRDPVKRAVREDGKDAVTDYELLAHHCSVSVVRFLPRTGRTHQIRVHASSSGFPVLADAVYGGGKDTFNKIAPMCRPFCLTIYNCFNRHALHARSISFAHPASKKEIRLSAPFPKDFNLALALFEKAGESAGNI